MSDSTLRQNAPRGVVFMLAGMFAFSVNDALGKWLLTDIGIGQLMVVRSAAAMLILIGIMLITRAPSPLSAGMRGIQALRVLLSTAEVWCFYFAVLSMPLATVMTFWLASPIYVAALSPLLLGEHVGWRRWLAIIIGFLGVIVTLDPVNQPLSFATLIALVGTAFFALIMILGRQLRSVPDTTLVFWQTLGALVVGLIVAPFEWKPMALDLQLGLLALLGIVAMMAHALVNRSLKLADAATVAPLQYTLLPWSIVFGWSMFGEQPKLHMLLGATLIIASGLFIFFREQQLKKKANAGTVTPDMP